MYDVSYIYLCLSYYYVSRSRCNATFGVAAKALAGNSASMCIAPLQMGPQDYKQVSSLSYKTMPYAIKPERVDEKRIDLCLR